MGWLHGSFPIIELCDKAISLCFGKQWLTRKCIMLGHKVNLHVCQRFNLAWQFLQCGSPNWFHLSIFVYCFIIVKLVAMFKSYFFLLLCQENWVCVAVVLFFFVNHFLWRLSPLLYCLWSYFAHFWTIKLMTENRKVWSIYFVEKYFIWAHLLCAESLRLYQFHHLISTYYSYIWLQSFLRDLRCIVY